MSNISVVATNTKVDASSGRLTEAASQAAMRAQPGRRFIAAWVYDFLPCFWLSVLVINILSCIPAMGFLRNVPLLVVAMLIFLTRDSFFEGRGVGKNFLGLQVLDIKSGMPASLKQSIVRNFVLVGPYLIYQLAYFLFFSIQVSHGETGLLAIKYLAQAIAILLLPIEGYRMHKGNGQRLADKLAGTIVVFQQSDFRNPFSCKNFRSSQ